jgi:octaprenyl-diphosphate synthase
VTNSRDKPHSSSSDTSGSKTGFFETVSEISAKEIFHKHIQNLTDLVRVDALIQSKFCTNEGYHGSKLLPIISEYLFSLGGKKLRPILTLLTGKACGIVEVPESLVTIAAGIELIHMATLLHDDIIDNSLLRRHKPSPLALYGDSNTLLTGDFLLVRAFSLCSFLDRVIINETEKACIGLTEGEITETSIPLGEHTEESCIFIARNKTAALFRLAAFSAAFIAKLDPAVCEIFAAFGENIGIAFQILDDILDITSTEASLGKKPGTDIREKKPSIINILWLQSSSKLAKETLLAKDTLCAGEAQHNRNIVYRQNPSLPKNVSSSISDNELTVCINEIKSLDVIQKARILARNYAEKALECFSKGIEMSSGIRIKQEFMGPSSQPEETSKGQNSQYQSILSLLALMKYTLDRME